MDENRVVSLPQKGAIDDPLTEILRAGARRLIAQAVEAEFETFLAANAELVLSDRLGAWFATGMIRSARTRRGSDPWTCKSRRPAIGCHVALNRGLIYSWCTRRARHAR